MRKTLGFALAACLLVQSAAFGQQPIRFDDPDDKPRPPGRSSMWKLSAILAVSAAVADSHSSWGRLELNPLLRGANGRFGVRSVSLKALLTGGSIGAQYLLLRRNPKAEKYGTVTNFVMAGVLGAAAVNNYRLAANEKK